MLLNSRKATTSFTRAGPFIGLLCEHWLRLRWVQRMVDILDESSWPPACLVPPSWHECGLQRSTHPWVHSHPFFLFSLALSKPMISQLSHFQLAGNLTTSFFMWERRLYTLYKLCPRKIFFLPLSSNIPYAQDHQDPPGLYYDRGGKLKYHWSRLECILITVCSGCKYIHPIKNSGARKWPQGESMFSLELDKNSIYHLALHYNGWPQWDLGSFISL